MRGRRGKEKEKELKQRIRSLLEEGKTYKEIREETGASQGTIARVKKEKGGKITLVPTSGKLVYLCRAGREDYYLLLDDTGIHFAILSGNSVIFLNEFDLLFRRLLAIFAAGVKK
jgi:hypothetical protein